MADYQNRKPPIGAFASMARWLPASAALILAVTSAIFLYVTNLDRDRALSLVRVGETSPPQIATEHAVWAPLVQSFQKQGFGSAAPTEEEVRKRRARDGIEVLRIAGGRDNETIRIFTLAPGSDGFLASDPHLKSILSAVLDGDR
jgi:hypothetical protein